MLRVLDLRRVDFLCSYERGLPDDLMTRQNILDSCKVHQLRRADEPIDHSYRALIGRLFVIRKDYPHKIYNRSPNYRDALILFYEVY